ncbi:hypothetical protein PDE_01102 [Penicillium oxalicum 114-2]|uniref:Uncharacterized protein n=1 Tax=Penicillium oxalicum (strain 114-2 / CGMCC 5302) TaxID=933388 RepID=S7ZBU5_PENO1|nr:hypothetical protein PDE_01102 [Penicillium oxalicum 114-2]
MLLDGGLGAYGSPECGGAHRVMRGTPYVVVNEQRDPSNIDASHCVCIIMQVRFPAAPTFQDTREAWREEGGKTNHRWMDDRSGEKVCSFRLRGLPLSEINPELQMSTGGISMREAIVADRWFLTLQSSHRR